MRFGIVGLGRMGSNIGVHALQTRHEPIGYDPRPPRDLPFPHVASLELLVQGLEIPRLVWLYVPHGEATDAAISALRDLLTPGDLIVDGGNSHWEDSKRHYQELRS